MGPKRQRRYEALQSLVQQFYPSYEDSTRSGYEGTKESYVELLSYASSVFKAQAAENQKEGINQRIIQPEQEIESEPFWIKNIRTRIESILIQPAPAPIPSTETPLYNELVSKEKKHEAEIESLRKSVQKPVVDNFPPLSKEALAKVKAALSPGPDPVVSGFNVDLCRSDFGRMTDGQWLNDELINFYGQLLMERSKTGEKYPRIHFFNTFFLAILKKSGYNSVRRWTKKTDLFAMDIVIVPVHLSMHWCCGAINFKKKRFEYYDSLHGNNPGFFKAMREYIQAESLDKKKVAFDLSGWTDYCPKSIPAQQNGYDCGVFTCTFADYLSRDLPFDFSQKDMQYLRKRITYELLEKKLMTKL
ncbi:SUMO1 sentrin specific peptidase 1 [Chytridiales sp. JEL 0842]|nr:SUMO1 sentrin specific peptidase 1 [Chytridiales sp. JEL 0842]